MKEAMQRLAFLIFSNFPWKHGPPTMLNDVIVVIICNPPCGSMSLDTLFVIFNLSRRNGRQVVLFILDEFIIVRAQILPRVSSLQSSSMSSSSRSLKI